MGGHIVDLGSVHNALLKRFTPAQVVKRDSEWETWRCTDGWTTDSNTLACTATTFYTKPVQNAVVSLNEALDIEWNTACIGQPSTVDVSLISTVNASLIAQFRSVDFSAGAYSVSDYVPRRYIRPPSLWHLPPVSSVTRPRSTLVCSEMPPV
jgi:hypothetical protein